MSFDDFKQDYFINQPILLEGCSPIKSLFPQFFVYNLPFTHNMVFPYTFSSTKVVEGANEFF
jgi:hypothetical protein